MVIIINSLLMNAFLITTTQIIPSNQRQHEHGVNKNFHHLTHISYISKIVDYMKRFIKMIYTL